jgi:chromosome segregation ATPase
LKELLRKCEDVVAVLDEIYRELDDLEARLRRCSWRLTSLKDEAMNVEEVEGTSLRKARLDKASDMLSKASARLLKLSEMVDKACFEVKAFVMEGSRVAREVQGGSERSGGVSIINRQHSTIISGAIFASLLSRPCPK